jgi:hypothetical protein
MSLRIALEILAGFALVGLGGVVWTRHCNRTGKPNADWLLDTPWGHWKDLNRAERTQFLAIVLLAVALIAFSQRGVRTP